MPSIKEYKDKIEHGLFADCESIVEMIKTLVLAKPSPEEPKAFFVKMVGDYYRYTAEIATGERLEQTK